MQPEIFIDDPRVEARLKNADSSTVQNYARIAEHDRRVDGALAGHEQAIGTLRAQRERVQRELAEAEAHDASYPMEDNGRRVYRATAPRERLKKIAAEFRALSDPKIPRRLLPDMNEHLRSNSVIPAPVEPITWPARTTFTPEGYERLQAQTDAALQDMRRIETAPLPPEEAKSHLRAHIAQIATPPGLKTFFRSGKVDDRTGEFVPHVKRGIEIPQIRDLSASGEMVVQNDDLAWLLFVFKDEIAAKLESILDQQARPNAMSSAAKLKALPEAEEKYLAALRREVDYGLRLETAINAPVFFHERVHPYVLLGVEVAPRKAIAWSR